MSFEFYKVVHLIGIFATFMALGALTLHTMNGGSKDHPQRKFVGMTHGIALLVILVAGFGMIAKAKIGMPAWVWLKLGIWLFLGGSLAVIPKKPHLAKPIWIVLILTGALAAYLAIYKPF